MDRPKYEIIDEEEIIQTIEKLCKEHEEIQLVYLYGSYAQGYQTEYSDIDIGVILDKNFEKKGLYSIELGIEIEKLLEKKVYIDLRILNNATPRFLFNVLKNGKNIFARSQRFFHEFEIRVLYDYQDIKPMLDYYDKLSISEVLDD